MWLNTKILSMSHSKIAELCQQRCIQQRMRVLLLLRSCPPVGYYTDQHTYTLNWSCQCPHKEILFRVSAENSYRKLEPYVSEYNLMRSMSVTAQLSDPQCELLILCAKTDFQFKSEGLEIESRFVVCCSVAVSIRDYARMYIRAIPYQCTDRIFLSLFALSNWNYYDLTGSHSLTYTIIPND